MRHVKMRSSWEDPDTYMSLDSHVRVGVDADDIFDDASAAIVNVSWFSGDDHADQGGERLCAV